MRVFSSSSARLCAAFIRAAISALKAVSVSEWSGASSSINSYRDSAASKLPITEKYITANLLNERNSPT